MTFILREGRARLKKGRGDIYLPPISICSKNYSHTARRSYCNFTTAKLELPGLCIPSCTRKLTRGSRWPPGIVFNYCFSLGDGLLPQQFWQPGMCPSWHIGKELFVTSGLYWQWEMTVGGKPEGSQPEVGGLSSLPWQLTLWQKGKKARAHRNISASRKAASPQRGTPPQSLFEKLAPERGWMGECLPQASCQPAHCTAWLPDRMLRTRGLSGSTKPWAQSPAAAACFNAVPGRRASVAALCRGLQRHHRKALPCRCCSSAPAGTLPCTQSSPSRWLLVKGVVEMQIRPPESTVPAGLRANKPRASQSVSTLLKAGAVQRALHGAVTGEESRVARTHCQPPFPIGCGTWQNWMVPLGTKLGCRGRDEKAHEMDFPVLSVTFCRTMTFISKLLTLTFCETQAELSSPEGTYWHKVIVLWQLFVMWPHGASAGCSSGFSCYINEEKNRIWGKRAQTGSNFQGTNTLHSLSGHVPLIWQFF